MTDDRGGGQMFRRRQQKDYGSSPHSKRIDCSVTTFAVQPPHNFDRFETSCCSIY